jgi:hypothetical protein
MGPFAAGAVVLVQFPFSDLTASKLRPAVVLAEAGRGDWPHDSPFASVPRLQHPASHYERPDNCAGAE